MLLRPVQDGLAMKPISATWSAVRPALLQQRLDRLGMGLGQKPLGVADGIGHRRAFRHAARFLQGRAQQRPVSSP